uniref:Zona occludens protein 1 n=1 Tax=Sinocyclocheilus grahami TaxID=75366 RepID=A0A672QNC2_SINGR
MEETVIWEQHTVTLHRAPGFGFGIAISGGRDNPHFQSGETSIVISDVLKGGPAEGLLQENDRVVMVNGVSMDNVEHAYAVQQLRKSGKNAKITIRRKRKVQIPVSRGGDRETMSEREEEDDTEEDDYEGPARAGGASGGTSSRNERSGSTGRRDHSNSRERSISPRSDRRSVASNVPPRPSKVTLVKSRKNEEYGLRLASHIFVKDISPESLAARDGNIQEGDVVLKINGTVTENLSLIDAKKLIERSKGKLKMVVQRDERATLLNIPDMDDSIPSANSDRDDISEIHSLASDHSHEHTRRSRSRSPDKRSEPSDISGHSPQQMSNGSHRSREEERISKPAALSTPVKMTEDALLVPPTEQPGDKQIPPLPEPKPVYAQPGQPDVDLPVSPSDAPVPNVTHDDSILRPSMKLVKFKKGESVGLRLAGGNDVGIFVAGVLEDSPAAKEGLEEGDQILRVNNVDFANIIREEAVLFLLDLPRGEEVTILAQRKKDVYRRIVESDVGDSFYIRTHFEYEKESPYGLSFNKGEVFRVVDTLYNGKLGSWLAIRIGKNHQEVERGIIPNKNRAEQLSSVQYTLPKTTGGDRADFWRFRGLRSSKRNLRKSREDVSAQPVQTKFPAYERVVLREAGFLRPVVIFGPIADVARDKLAREVPDMFELASECPFVNTYSWPPLSHCGVQMMLHLSFDIMNIHIWISVVNEYALHHIDAIQQQQNQLVWVSEGKAEGAPDNDLDLHDDRLSYVSAPGSEYSMYSTDSRHTSDYEDTDTEGGAYTDQELDETLNDEVGPPSKPAITRSSEPVREDPPVIQEPPGYGGYQPEPLNRIDPAGFKAPAPQQVAFLRPNYNPQQPLYQEDKSPEPQQPQPKATDDIIRSNNNDPDEDEEYYRKQLSYFDRRSFDSKPSAQLAPAIKPTQPQTQPGYYPRYMFKYLIFLNATLLYFFWQSQNFHTFVYTFFHILSHTVTPPLDPHGSPKVKPPNHEDTVQSTYLPQKSFPDKSPVNGTGEPPKTNRTTTSSYNRFVPKPYTTSARPFERKFDSPKFNHNLLPNDSQNKTDNSSPQPIDHDSGLDTFTRTMDQKPKYQQNNINAVPKAIPVSPSALEDDDDDDSHTVVATARGIFNSNGGVLSSIETGVSIIIPQGAIPDSVEQEIYFKVCRDNSILPPLDKEKGETLLSPLVMCGPHGLKFLKPVELRLPHCASMTPDGWSFALKSSDSSSGDPKSWQNKSLPGDPNYLVGANCVSVLIDHF